MNRRLRAPPSVSGKRPSSPQRAWWSAMRPSTVSASAATAPRPACRWPRRAGSCGGPRGAPSWGGCRGTPPSRRSGTSGPDRRPPARGGPASPPVPRGRGKRPPAQAAPGRRRGGDAGRRHPSRGRRGSRRAARRAPRRWPRRRRPGRPGRTAASRSRRGSWHRRRRPWRPARRGGRRCRGGGGRCACSASCGSTSWRCISGTIAQAATRGAGRSALAVAGEVLLVGGRRVGVPPRSMDGPCAERGRRLRHRHEPVPGFARDVVEGDRPRDQRPAGSISRGGDRCGKRARHRRPEHSTGPRRSVRPTSVRAPPRGTVSRVPWGVVGWPRALAIEIRRRGGGGGGGVCRL